MYVGLRLVPNIYPDTQHKYNEPNICVQCTSDVVTQRIHKPTYMLGDMTYTLGDNLLRNTHLVTQHTCVCVQHVLSNTYTQQISPICHPTYMLLSNIHTCVAQYICGLATVHVVQRI